jgi:hypothetical protein
MNTSHWVTGARSKSPDPCETVSVWASIGFLDGTGTGEPGNSRQQMQKQDCQIAHAMILASSQYPRMLTNLAVRHAKDWIVSLQGWGFDSRLIKFLDLCEGVCLVCVFVQNE